MPLGYTFGNDKLHGFTWGLRGSVVAYPSPSARGVGLGGYAEALLDAQTHSAWTLGGTVTGPVANWDWVDLRVGGTAGWTWKGTANEGSGLAVGALTELVLPAYLYDFRVGFRVNGVFGNSDPTTSLLLDLDLVGLLGVIGYALGAKR